MRSPRDLTQVVVRLLDPPDPGKETENHPNGQPGWDAPISEGGGPLAGGLVLTRSFAAELDDPGVNAVLTLEIAARAGRLSVTSAKVSERPAGPPITGAILRAIPIESYVDYVREELARLDGASLLVQQYAAIAPVPDGMAAESEGPPASDVWETFAARQRGRPDEKLLPGVATLYREALASNDPTLRTAPTAYVARKLHYHRGHAARLVAQAREDKLLGPATPGLAGE